jgi:Fur family ferric uptake transcriptional regulator
MDKPTSTLRVLEEDAPENTSAEQLVDALRTKGFRITKIRQAMIEALVAARQPLSAPQLLEQVSLKHPSVNKTTIYRELDFLADNKILSEIDILDGMKRYEILHPNHHHHHLVCTSCRDIQCVEVPHHDLHALEEKIQQTHNFSVQSHVLEFFGVCKKCS